MRCTAEGANDISQFSIEESSTKKKYFFSEAFWAKKIDQRECSLVYRYGMILILQVFIVLYKVTETLLV